MIRQMYRLAPILLAACAACGSPTASVPAATIPSGAVDVAWNDAGAVRIAHSYYSGLRQPARTIVDNDAAWRTIWATYTANSGNPPVPAVDFTRYDVIVAALGERMTGGYDITVSRIAATNEYLYVEVTSVSPGPRCFTTQALTQPVDMVRIPRQHPPVVFVEKQVKQDC